MIPSITINGQQLTLSQIRLLRKLLIDYMQWLSEAIWEYVEKNDPDMSSLPLQRTRGFELLEMIDGVRPQRHYFAEDGYTYVVINGTGMAFPYGEMTRMSLSHQTDIQLSAEESSNLKIMMTYVFKRS